jgi:Tfp pilus assembly pilus retraction ATPase PilT
VLFTDSDILLPWKFINIRVNEELTPVVQYPQLTKDDIVGMLQVMVSPESLRKLNNLEEVDFAYDYAGKVRFRGNVYIRSGSLGVALRAIQKVRSLKELNLPDVLEQFTRPRQGSRTRRTGEIYDTRCDDRYD